MPEAKPRVLIIDDEPDSVGLLLEFLAQHYLLMVSLDGEDGFRKAKLGSPDVILLDLAMPKLDGFETCRLLKAEPVTTDIPVIFLSAHAAENDRLAGFAVGAADFIAKPFTDKEVLARVAVHVSTAVRLRKLEFALASRSGTEGAFASLVGQGPVLGTSPSLETADARAQLVFRASVFLREHLDRVLELEEIAVALKTTERHLNAVFRQRLGLSVYEFCLELRMATARQHLEQADFQIQRIATLVGYSNAGDFTRAFRRRFGMTPREFRQSRAGNAVNDRD